MREQSPGMALGPHPRCWRFLKGVGLHKIARPHLDRPFHSLFAVAWLVRSRPHRHLQLLSQVSEHPHLTGTCGADVHGELVRWFEFVVGHTSDALIRSALFEELD